MAVEEQGERDSQENVTARRTTQWIRQLRLNTEGAQYASPPSLPRAPCSTPICPLSVSNSDLKVPTHPPLKVIKGCVTGKVLPVQHHVRLPGTQRPHKLIHHSPVLLPAQPALSKALVLRVRKECLVLGPHIQADREDLHQVCEGQGG